MKYKVGDRVKVVNRFKGHLFKIGDIVTITEEIPDGNPPHYRADSDTAYWWLNDDEIELYEEKKMTKYTTEPIDYTECHPVIAEHLKRGEAILCRVTDDYCNNWVVNFMVSGYRKHSPFHYSGWFIGGDGNVYAYAYAEPIPIKRKVLMSAEKVVVKLIENGWKIGTNGRICHPTGPKDYYLSELKLNEGKGCEIYKSLPDYLFEEVDD